MSDNHYEVEGILGVRLNDKKIVQILVKWAGSGFNQATWENLEDSNCKALLKPFKMAINWLKGKCEPSEDLEDEGPLRRGLYKIDNIIGVRVNTRRRPRLIEYYIKWRGYNVKHNTWEPERNVYCQQYTQFFEDAVYFMKNNYCNSKGLRKKPKNVATVVDGDATAPEQKVESKKLSRKHKSPNRQDGRDDDRPLISDEEVPVKVEVRTRTSVAVAGLRSRSVLRSPKTARRIDSQESQNSSKCSSNVHEKPIATRKGRGRPRKSALSKVK